MRIQPVRPADGPDVRRAAFLRRKNPRPRAGVRAGDGVAQAPPCPFAHDAGAARPWAGLNASGPGAPLSASAALLVAVNEVHAGAHSFTALIEGGSNSQGKAILDGIVMAGSSAATSQMRRSGHAFKG